MKKQWLGLLLMVVAIISGCVSDNTPLTRTTGQDQWQLQGKIGLVYPEKNCAGQSCRMQSDQGQIDWQQNRQTYRMTLKDPFGRVVMTIDGDSQALIAKSPEQPPIQTTPNAFTAILAKQSDNQTLSTLAPDDLRFWVTGRPNPNTTASIKGSDAFEQNGYSISAKQWRQTPVGKMPSLITVTKGAFKMRLVVREWLAT